MYCHNHAVPSYNNREYFLMLMIERRKEREFLKILSIFFDTPTRSLSSNRADSLWNTHKEKRDWIRLVTKLCILLFVHVHFYCHSALWFFTLPPYSCLVPSQYLFINVCILCELDVCVLFTMFLPYLRIWLVWIGWHCIGTNCIETPFMFRINIEYWISIYFPTISLSMIHFTFYTPHLVIVGRMGLDRILRAVAI